MAVESSRENQRRRTRKDLLAAAARLLKQGQSPDMDAIAKEAMVSRATAYRYFPSVEALLVEAPLDSFMPDPDTFFANDDSTDAIARAQRAEAALHTGAWANEKQLRLMLAASMDHAATGKVAGDVPIRQNRRTPLIEAALAPIRPEMTPAVYEKLCAALSLVFGTESMIVFKDVLRLDERAARRVKAWAIKSLIETAMREAGRRE